MEKVIHKAEERGKGEYGWLRTRYSFSFADWYEPTKMGFGALRVLNDDRLLPDSGFPEHSHRDMEIITIVTKGTVTHKDNMGNVGTISAGNVQVMSAGTGIAHSEYNESEAEELELFQLWIEPSIKNGTPRYAQKPFTFLGLEEGVIQLVEPTGTEGLLINQDAYILYMAMRPGTTSEYQLHAEENGVYIFVVEGTISAEGEDLGTRDALGVSGKEFVNLSSNSGGKLLIIEIPMLA